MGIDLPWVIEHPDWFLSLDYCPFPSHRFEGPDLSPDPSVVIQIEDHYYDRTDAAVASKRTTGIPEKSGTFIMGTMALPCHGMILPN